MEIKNKVIIITGASQGIGLAAAKYLAGMGAKVVLAARSEETLKKLEKEIPNSFAVKTDMRKEKDVISLVEKTINKYGRIDVFVNNAGQGIYGKIESINIKDYKEVMELNVYAVLRAMQEVIPYMKKQGGGLIVNVSSMVAKMYLPSLAAYASTKYALNAISFTARQELEKDNIRICTVSPKMTATNFGQNSIGSRPQWSSSSDGPRQEIDSAEKVAEKIAEVIKSEQAEVTL